VLNFLLGKITVMIPIENEPAPELEFEESWAAFLGTLGTLPLLMQWNGFKRVMAAWMVVFFTVFTAMPSWTFAETIQFENGSVDVTTQDNVTNWNVTGNPVWNVPEFNVAEGATHNIVGLSSGASLALLVNGGSATNIFGTMNLSNLAFILQNVNGINIGASGLVNVNHASFIASTLPLNLDATNFLTQQYRFKGDASSLLKNEGRIVGHDASLVALVANAIENKGTIEVPAGTVALAAGKTVTIGVSPDGMVSIGVDEATAHEMGLDDQIKNSGTISASGGRVVLDAQAIDDIFDRAINIDPSENATAVIVADDGVIEFVAQGDVKVSGDLRAENGTITAAVDGELELIGDITASNSTFNADKVKLTGLAAQTFKGDMTITNLEITTSGKTVYFESGKTYTLLGHTEIQGEGGYAAGYIRLFSSVKGSPWYINITGDYHIAYAGIRDSHYLGEGLVTAYPKADYGGNTGWAHNDSVIDWTTLDLIRSNLSASYLLGANLSKSDIDYSGIGDDFDPIGGWNGQGNFSGSFDGKGYTISDLVINKPFDDYVGLFGKTSGGTISNVGLLGGAVTGKTYTGALIGYNSGTAITNVYNTGTVTGVATAQYQGYVGGLVGYHYSGSLTNSYNTGDVTGSSDFVGGLAGRSGGTITGSYNSGIVTNLFGNRGSIGGITGDNSSTISNSYNTGNIFANYHSVGGLVGVNGTSGLITNSYNTGNVTVTGTVAQETGGIVGRNWAGSVSQVFNSGTVSGYVSVGGIAGRNYSTGANSSISQAYNTGNVTASNYQAGGVVGSNEGSYSTIANSYNTGNVTTSGGSAGGVVGYLYVNNANVTSILNSYNTGTVAGGTSYAGGVVGYHYYGKITNSYNTGEVSGEAAKTGGFMGYYYNGVQTNNWWFNTNSGAAGVGAPTGITKAAAATDFNGTGSGTGGAVYIGATTWDFSTTPVWKAVQSSTPLLDWECNVWTNGNNTGAWSDPLNWSKGLPTLGTTALFNNTSTAASVVDAGFSGSIAKLYIDSNYDNTLTLQRSLAGGSTYFQASGILAGTPNVLTATTYNVQKGVISAILGGTGSVFNKTTANTVTLSGANTYTGLTTISAGTLQLGASGVIADTSAVTVASGAILDLNGYSEEIGSLAGAGTVTSSAAGDLTLTAGGDDISTTFSGNIENGSATSVGLTKTGAGVLTLSGTNTYAGITTISEGILTATTTGALPGWDTNGRFAVGAGAGLALYNAFTDGNIATMLGTTNFAAGALLGFDTTTADRSYGVLADTAQGSLSLLKLGSNALTLSGVNTFTGKTAINGGTLKISAESGLGANPGGFVADHLTLNGGTLQTTATFSFNSNRGITLGASGGTFSTDASTILTLPTVIAGAGALTKSGTGTLIVSGPNSYAGLTTLSAGLLKLSTGSGANTQLGTADAGVVVVSGAALDLNGVTLETEEALNLKGTGISSGGALLNSSATGVTYSGLITLGADSSIVATNGGITLTNTGTITGNYGLTLSGGAGTNSSLASVIATNSNSLTKTGAGTWTLLGANTYTGVTYVNTGTLKLGASGVIPDSSSVFAAGTFDLNGYNETIGMLATSGVVTSSVAGDLLLTVGGNNASYTFSGMIQNGSATSISLVKTGTGTLTLSGINTYTGTTTVSAGTLQFGKQLSLYNNTPASWTAENITVASGATLALNVGGAGEFNSSDVDILKGLGSDTGGFTNGSFIAFDTANASGNNFTYGGVIADTNSGANSLGLKKLGNNVLTLSGDNSYSGVTTISAGTLKLGAAGSGANTPLGTVVAGTVVSYGAALDLNGFSLSTAEALSLNGTGVSSGGALTNSSATSATYSGLISLVSNAVSIVASSGDIILSNPGTITGSVGLTLGGTSTGSSIASIIGTTSGTVTKTGTGTWILSGANTYTGKTSIQGGTLSVSSLGKVTGGTASNLGIPSSVYNGTIDLGSGATSGTLKYTGTGETTDRVINLYGSTGGAVLDQSGTGILTFSNPFTATGGGIKALTLQGSTSGTGVIAGAIVNNSGTNTTGITKAGTGTWTLSGTNTYTGVTTLTDGILSVATIGNGGSSGNLGAATNAAANLVFNGGTLQYTGSSSGTDRNFTINAGTTGTIDVTTNNLTIAGASTNTTGALTKIGAGTLTLSGSNLHTGATTVNAGLLTGNGSLAGPVTNNATISGLTVAGTVTNNSAISGGTYDGMVHNLTLGSISGGAFNGTLSMEGGVTSVTPTYGASATLQYKGTGGTQTTGLELPATIPNLTVDNISGVILSASPIVTGAVTMTSGLFLVSVSADSGLTKVYGSADPVFTYTTSGYLVNGDAYTGALSRVAGSDVGAYAITQGTLMAGDHYSIAFNSADFVITAKPVIVMADAGQNKVYGASDPVLTYTATALVGSDSFSGALSRAAGETVLGGPYTASGATGTGLSNYTISYVSGDLTVNAKSLAITADNATKTYGDVVTFAGTEFTQSGLVNSDSVTSVSLASAGAGATATVGSSPYDITASGATGTGLSNYTISYVSGDLTVNAKSLAITADNVTKTYGDVVTFAGTEFTQSGLVNSDSVTSVSLASAGAGATATVGSSPYDITASGATGTGLSNYTISYVDGHLTVDRKDLTITANDQTKTYGDSDLGTTDFSSLGLVTGDEITSVALTSADAELSTSGNYKAGNWHITADDASGDAFDANNYDITYNTGALTVEQKDLSATGITAKNKTYNGNTDATLDYTDAELSGNVAGDDVALLETGVGTFEEAGPGLNILVNITDLSISGDDAANYHFDTTATTSADILPAPPAPSSSGPSASEAAAINGVINRTENDLTQSDPLTTAPVIGLANGAPVVTLNGIEMDGNRWEGHDSLIEQLRLFLTGGMGFDPNNLVLSETSPDLQTDEA